MKLFLYIHTIQSDISHDLVKHRQSPDYPIIFVLIQSNKWIYADECRR